MTTWGGEEFDLDAYTARIGYTGELRPTIDVLKALHRAHVGAIVFENLEAALERPVRLDVKSLQTKLVERRRGGYCYERNSLLAAALERIGFQVAGRGARNRTREDALPPVTHALLVVTLDGEPWLADAGFGQQGPLEPVPLRDGAVVEQGGWTFGVRAEDEGILVLRSLRPEGRVDPYAFAPQTLYPGDFTVMNHYSATHPQSRFRGQAIVQRTGPGARRGLIRDELTTVRADGTRTRRRVEADEWGHLLADVSGIELSDEDVAVLAAPDLRRA